MLLSLSLPCTARLLEFSMTTSNGQLAGWSLACLLAPQQLHAFRICAPQRHGGVGGDETGGRCPIVAWAVGGRSFSASGEHSQLHDLKSFLGVCVMSGRRRRASRFLDFNLATPCGNAVAHCNRSGWGAHTTTVSRGSPRHLRLTYGSTDLSNERRQ